MHRTKPLIILSLCNAQKGYPFEVLLPSELQIQGVILADQIKCLDWKARCVEFIEAVPESVVEEVQAKIALLIL